jgi:hypothetical protein
MAFIEAAPSSCPLFPESTLLCGISRVSERPHSAEALTQLTHSLGRNLKVPIYELLGGKVRNKVQVYCWIGGDRPSDVEAEA